MAPSSRDVLQYKELLSLDLSGRNPYDILVSGRAAAREDHSPTRQHQSLESGSVARRRHWFHARTCFLRGDYQSETTLAKTCHAHSAWSVYSLSLCPRANTTCLQVGATARCQRTLCTSPYLRCRRKVFQLVVSNPSRGLPLPAKAAAVYQTLAISRVLKRSKMLRCNPAADHCPRSGSLKVNDSVSCCGHPMSLAMSPGD